MGEPVGRAAGQFQGVEEFPGESADSSAAEEGGRYMVEKDPRKNALGTVVLQEKEEISEQREMDKKGGKTPRIRD